MRSGVRGPGSYLLFRIRFVQGDLNSAVSCKLLATLPTGTSRGGGLELTAES